MLGGSMMMPGGEFDIPFSVLFDGSTGFLSRTPAAAGDRTTHTLSWWEFRWGLAAYYGRFTASISCQNFYDPNNKAVFSDAGGNLTPASVKRDATGWVHCQLVHDTSNATASERKRYYENGERVTAFDTETYPALDAETAWNNAITHNIGRTEHSAAQYVKSYMAEIHFVDGQAVDPTSFGKADPATGEWKPIKYTGTHGTNGYHLDFAQDNGGTPSLGNDLGTDVSGNGNHWAMSASGLKKSIHTPTHASCLWNLNDLVHGTMPTLSDGNRLATAGSNYGSAVGTLLVDGGKVYWENKITVNDTYPTRSNFGLVCHATFINDAANYRLENNLGAVCIDDEHGGGIIRVILGGVAIYTEAGSLADNDIVGFALDADIKRLWVHINGTYLNVGDPAAGTGYVWDASTDGDIGDNFTPGFSGSDTGQSAQLYCAAADWTYSAPTGFVEISTNNLPIRSPKVPSSPQTGDFTGTGAADGPFINLAMAVDQSGVSTINGNAITWGTHAIATATGFKVITSSTSYNATGANTYSIAVKAYAGGANVPEATAQSNPE